MKVNKEINIVNIAYVFLFAFLAFQLVLGLKSFILNHNNKNLSSSTQTSGQPNPQNVQNPQNPVSQNGVDMRGFMQAYNNKDYQNAVTIGEQIINNDPNDLNLLSMLAYSCLESKYYEKSAYYYKRYLAINPNDKDAKAGLAYVNYYIQNNRLHSNINNLTVVNRAPDYIHKLVKTNLSSSIKTETEALLDLIWSEPNGQKYLSTIAQANIPIYVISTGARPQTVSYNFNGRACVKYIEIPQYSIQNLNNQDSNANALNRIASFSTILHEIGHAFFHIKNPQVDNSLEEEMGVEMIAFNISYKIISGNYLSRDRVKEIAPQDLKGFLSDDHRDLPVYSGFDRIIQGEGISMPYPEEYSNLVAMYKTLLARHEVGHVPNLDAFVRN